MVPSSLRRLTLGKWFRQPLQVGSLPEGLLFLCFQPHKPPSLLLPLQPGVLQSTLLSLDLSNRHLHLLPAGIIPSGVRWLCLSERYPAENIEAALPPHAEIQCEPDETTEMQWPL